MAFDTLSLIQAGTPTNFAERGASVPFTTPALVGARVRLAVRGGTELVVPNPSGWRGDYVLGWDGLDALCRATVHDRQLIARLRGLASPDPSSVRDAAWQVAAAGFAGPAARLAAAAALSADRTALARTAGALLNMLVGVAPAALASLRRTELAYADRGADPAAGANAGNGLVATVGNVAAALAPLGCGVHAPAARLPRLLARLAAMRDAIRLGTPQGTEAGVLAETVAAAAAVVIDDARMLLDDVGAAMRDIAGVLHRWIVDPAASAAWFARTGWLLDGWEPVALLWADAAQDGSAQALAQLVALLPIQPAEADLWLGRPALSPAPFRPRRHQAETAPGPTDAAFERIARNEALRARAA